MLDVCNPMLRHARQMADQNRRTYALVRNSIGGTNIVPQQAVNTDEDTDVVAIVHPTPGLREFTRVRFKWQQGATI